MTEAPPKTIAEFILRYNIGTDCSKPTPYYDKGEDWPAIAYTVTLYDMIEAPDGTKSRRASAYDRHPIEFKLGIGHVKWRAYAGATSDERDIIDFHKRGRRYKKGHQAGLATVAANMARAQKVAPTAYDVLTNLQHTLREFYDRLSFEEWADEYGYNADSIKHRELYEKCQAEGHATYNWLGEARAVELLEAEDDGHEPKA